MSLTAEHYLSVYSQRYQMQEDCVTNPSAAVKQFTKVFVERLKKLDATTQIDSFQSSEKWSFVIKSTGEVIAELVHDI